MRTHEQIMTDLTKYSKLLQSTLSNDEWHAHLKIYNQILRELDDYYKVYATCGNKKPCKCSICADLKERFPLSTAAATFEAV
jgi:hypothetical protein